MKVKKIIALLLAMSLMFAFSACGSNGDTTNSPADASNAGTSDTPDTTEPLTIAYSCVSYSLAPLTQALADNLQDRVEAQGWTFNMLTAEGDTELQGEQVSQLISMQPDYLLLMPGDPTLAVDWLEEAAAADVPVIIVHIALSEGTEDNALCYVGVDNTQIINAIYDYMIEHNPDTQLNIVEIGGVPTQADYIVRTEAFNALVAGNENLTQLGDIAWAYSSRADAQTAMENFPTVYGDQVNVVMGFADNLTLGAVAALDEADRDDVQVYSIVYCEASYDAIKEGKMVSVFTSTGMMADRVIECILANEAGETIEYDQHIECPVIDASNVDEYEAEF